MTDPALLTQLVIVTVIAGMAAGTLAGLLGVGGGIVIVPALYFAFTNLGVPTDVVMQLSVGTSLATIVFTSASSAQAHWRRGAIDRKLIFRWVPWIGVGVVMGGLLAGFLSGRAMLVIFSVTAITVALDLVLRRRRDRVVPRTAPYPAWAGLGIFAGGLSSLMGIGGGSICVPILSFLGYDMRRAVGNSSAIGFAIGLPGAITYAITGIGKAGLPPWSAGYVNLIALVVIIPLTMSFARIGAALAHRLPPAILRRVFAFFLAITGVRMMIEAFTI